MGDLERNFDKKCQASTGKSHCKGTFCRKQLTRYRVLNDYCNFYYKMSLAGFIRWVGMTW